MTVVVGAGTGRSGTKTLADILDACLGVTATHEHPARLPWEFDESLYTAKLAWLREGHTDVAFYYLPYLRRLLADEPEARIIITRRDPTDVARSYERMLGPRFNHWAEHPVDGWEANPGDGSYPTYPPMSRFDAIYRYACDYDTAADVLAAEFPDNVLIVATDTLGDKATQKRIFDHAAIPNRARRYSPGIHEGRTASYNTAPVLIGTYRKRRYVEGALRSMEQHLHGYDDVIFIDDSGDDAHATWLAQHGKVIATGGVGFMAAYQELCAAAEGRNAFLLEEDFRITVDVSIPQLTEHLYNRPYLSQVALLREGWWQEEKDAGGVLPFLAKERGKTVREVAGLTEIDAFTCNPSLVRGRVLAAGWPQQPHSEVIKERQLNAMGYRGAYLPGIQCQHVGDDKTNGYGY